MPAKKDTSRNWRASYEHWLLLQYSVVHRVASYFDDVGELIGAGSTQPREWLEDYAKLWSGVIDDVGDWMQRESGNPPRPSTAWVHRTRIELQQRLRKASIPFEVPLEAFPDQDNPKRQLTLRTGGLVRAGKGALLAMGEHVRLNDDKVSIDDRHRRLQLFDLPPLRVGDVYTGVILAVETRSPVVTVEVAIV